MEPIDDLIARLRYKVGTGADINSMTAKNCLDFLELAVALAKKSQGRASGPDCLGGNEAHRDVCPA